MDGKYFQKCAKDGDKVTKPNTRKTKSGLNYGILTRDSFDLSSKLLKLSTKSNLEFRNVPKKVINM